MSGRVLVLYASTHGHTATIAARVTERLRGHGLEAEVADVRAAPDTSPAAFDAVVVGASVHRGAHQPEVLAWVRRHSAELGLRRTALFSVSLTAADDSGDAQRTTRELIDELVDASDWTPDATAAFAGAFQYREYDVFTRTLMRLIAHRHGITTDIDEDVELTDWDAVDAFADRVAAMLGG